MANCCKHCLKLDNRTNWSESYCCEIHGNCEANEPDAIEGDITNCIHCGGELFFEEGNWWHNSQIEIPIDLRETTHE